MVDVALSKHFIRTFKKLERKLKEEALEKIKLFQSNPENPQLKAHKLSGVLKGRYSFSVNYKIRIIYMYLSETEIVLLAIGDHDIYD